MTPDIAIKIVKEKANLRTRYEGQEPFLDEVLVAEIERLGRELGELEQNRQELETENNARGRELELLREYREHHEFAVSQLAKMCGQTFETIGDVAAEIERLRAENVRLLELCQPISESRKEGEFWDAVERAATAGEGSGKRPCPRCGASFVSEGVHGGTTWACGSFKSCHISSAIPPVRFDQSTVCAARAAGGGE